MGAVAWGPWLEDAYHRLLFENTSKEAKTIPEHSPGPSPYPRSHDARSQDIHKKLTDVAYYLNTCLVDHAADSVSKGNIEPNSIEAVCFEDEAKAIPPEVWNFIFQFTLGR